MSDMKRFYDWRDNINKGCPYLRYIPRLSHNGLPIKVAICNQTDQTCHIAHCFRIAELDRKRK